MRNTLIFAGNSCPALTGQICENLGMAPADAELTQFSNVSPHGSIVPSPHLPSPSAPSRAFVFTQPLGWHRTTAPQRVVHDVD